MEGAETVGARKWRRKSRPIKLGRSTSEEELMDEEPETDEPEFTTDDKENSVRTENEGTCQLCSRVFGSKVQLQTHMRLHANGRGLSCDHCGKQYANKSKLKRHSRSHTGEKPYTCSICSKNFSRSDNLTTHVLRQHQAARVCACAKCYATYITIAELKEHRDSCHPGEAVFQCALCDEVKVETGDLLMEHLKAVHDDVIMKMTTEEPMNVDESETATPEKPLENGSGPSDEADNTSGASSVAKTDSSSNSGSKRKKATPKKLSRYDDSADSVSDEYDEVDSPTPTRHSSVDRMSEKDLTVMKHKIYTRKPEQNGPTSDSQNPSKRPRLSAPCAQSVPQSNVFACMKCDVVLDSEDLHNEHNELFHESRSDSPASYSSKGSIEEEWPNAVSCEICHLLLKNIHYLQRHLQRKHHDGIDYCCPKCPERQATLTGLIDHVRVQHSSGEESHCEDCNEMFPNKEDLQMHFRQHRVHQCNLCSKQFTMIHKLQKHLKRHLQGGKNQSCTICRGQFTSEKDLGQHVERHHGMSLEAYRQKAEKSSDEGVSVGIGTTRYAVNKPSMCMGCGRTLPYGMRRLRVSPNEQWANMCKECVERYQRPEYRSLMLQNGRREEVDAADDESSESGISGDESVSGKSAHHCGVCRVKCTSLHKLVLHMDSDHPGVDKRHLWDLLLESVLSHKQNQEDASNISYSHPRELKPKVLTPLNNNIKMPTLEEQRMTLNFVTRPQMVTLNQPLVVSAPPSTWSLGLTQDTSNLPSWVQKPKTAPIHNEILAMDLTSKKTEPKFEKFEPKFEPKFEKKAAPKKIFEMQLKIQEEEKKLDDIIMEAKFRCESCPAAFETEENLEAHTRNHEMNAQARCYICNQDMASQTELLKHLMLHRHTSYHCKVCGKSLSSWSKFEAHMGTHDNGAKFACCFCDIQFFDKARLAGHLLEVHDRSDSQICGACGKIYFDAKLLDDHIKEHEDDDMTPPPSILPIVENKEGQHQRGRPRLRRMVDERRKEARELFFPSSLGPSSFPGTMDIDTRAQTFAASLLNRTLTTTTTDVSVSGPSPSKSVVSKPIRAESPLDKQSHVCVYCDKEFSALAKLQRHIRKHTGEKPFRCLYCEMRFSRSDNLHTHMVRRHTEEAERKCQECGDKYHNHSWSQWYQHLKYPGGIPKEMEAKKRARSPGQPFPLPTHGASIQSILTATSTDQEDRRPRFKVKSRREREAANNERQTPSMDDLGRLLPTSMDGTLPPYPFMHQNPLFRMGLTVDPATLQLIQPPSVVTSRALTDLPQMVMVQSDVLVKPIPTVLDSVGIIPRADTVLSSPEKPPKCTIQEQAQEILLEEKPEKQEEVAKSVSPEHGVQIEPDAAMLAANALVDMDQDMKDEDGEEGKDAVAMNDVAMETVEEEKDQDAEAPNEIADDDQEDQLRIDEQADEAATANEEIQEIEEIEENAVEAAAENDETHENGLDQIVEKDHEMDENQEQVEAVEEEKTKEMTPGEEAGTNGEAKTGDDAMECEFCPLVFDGINNLTDHMITHKNVDATELNTAIQRVMLCAGNLPNAGSLPEPPALVSPPIMETRSSVHACTQCDQTFSSKSQLAAHAKDHKSGDLPFSCTMCEKTFKTSSRLQRHLKTHTGDSPHACTYCGKKFGRKDNLKVHVNTAHGGADSTQCPKCSKRFETPYALRQHMRWHTDRKYECSVCGTSFTWKCYLTRHMKSRHPEMAEV